jgi:hypothetical protein
MSRTPALPALNICRSKEKATLAESGFFFLDTSRIILGEPVCAPGAFSGVPEPLPEL